jgi:cytoskeleton protein RodZ
MVAAVVAGVSILAAFSYFSNRQQDWPLQNLPARDLPSTTNSIEQASTTFNDNPGTPQQVQSPAPALVVDASLVQRSLSTAAAGPRQMKRLVLEFRDESWVEIKEQEGRTIFAQLNLGGTERGNAPAVQLTYDNSPVDLKPFTRIAVARLTLE